MSAQTPAYIHQAAHIHEDKGPRTVAASGFLIAITTLAVVLRLLAQRIVKPSFTADDYCAFFALVRVHSRTGPSAAYLFLRYRSSPLPSAVT